MSSLAPWSVPSWQGAVKRIARDRSKGASVLAEDALLALEDAWRSKIAARRAADLARKLASSRPSMPVLENVVNLATLRAFESFDAGRDPAAAVEAVREAARAARGAASRHAAAIAQGVVLTHSASETVLKAIRAAARAKRVSRVIVTEARPGREGRDASRALARDGVEVTHVVDATVALHVREADLVLVGADAVLPDGSIVNKAGTSLVALAARESSVPVLAVADAFKVSPREGVPLEEKAPEEVWSKPPPGVRVRNIYFDVTRGTLVHRLVTEEGALRAEAARALAERNRSWAEWQRRPALASRARRI